MQFTVERGGPLLPFLLEHVKGSRNHVKSLLARGQVQVDGAAVRRHDHPLAPGQRVSVLAQGAEARRAPFPVLYEDGRILVIDNNRIAEEGTHEELLALGGRYAKLWQTQQNQA